MIPSDPRDDGLPRVATGSASTSGCFGACTAFTRVAACLLAEPPRRPAFLEGFDGFVTSAAAPIATGWSDQLSGQESHLLKIRAFSRRTAIGTPPSAASLHRGRAAASCASLHRRRSLGRGGPVPPPLSAWVWTQLFDLVIWVGMAII